MELVNISGKFTALLKCKRCKTKNTKDLDKRWLKKNFYPTDDYWDCDENFCLMIRIGVCPYEYLNGWEEFEEIKLSQKNRL